MLSTNTFLRVQDGRNRERRGQEDEKKRKKMKMNKKNYHEGMKLWDGGVNVKEGLYFDNLSQAPNIFFMDK